MARRPDRYDFSGYATKNNVLCTDGRIISRDAFADNDGKKVPLVWNHRHDTPSTVLGHAFLENREDGVYAYGVFNDTPEAKHAKASLENGDIDSLSIFANQLTHEGNHVRHGNIRELSLVLAGANKEALIDDIISHGGIDDNSAMIFFGDNRVGLELAHSENQEEDQKNQNEGEDDQMAQEGKSVQEVYDTLTDEQKAAVDIIVGAAVENAVEDDDYDDDYDDYEEDDDMQHNAFDNEYDDTLAHGAIDFTELAADAKRCGSWAEAAANYEDFDDTLAHAVEPQMGVDYGFTNVGYLFPDYKDVNGGAPKFIKRNQEWVSEVINGAHHTPFSRIKSLFADITADEARARGYIKGKKKQDEVFTLLKRTTDPQTVYKKQRIDRDDKIDITGFDVIAWLKGEMRLMLDEEIARAILVGDGRLSSSEDKIQEQHVRPIWTDDDLYTIKQHTATTQDATAAEKAEAFVEACVRGRENYDGSGKPTLYTTEGLVTECLLLKDATGRRLYKSEEDLAKECRVSKIVIVPPMKDLTRKIDADTYELLGIITNIADYTIGADKGGSVNLFDDFDIDYNQYKYLIETRVSGALTVPHSAIAIEALKTKGV